MDWKKISGILGASSVGFILVMIGIFNLTGVTYTIPPNSECIGDFSSPGKCYGEFSIKTTYWSICFEQSNRIETMYKKTALSRTLWINLKNIKSITPTNPEVPVIMERKYYNKYIPVATGYCIPRNKVTYLRLVGTLQPGQVVKYGFNANSILMKDIYYDPVWSYQMPSESRLIMLNSSNLIINSGSGADLSIRGNTTI